MISARERVLVEGQHDWVKLWSVHRYVAEDNLSASLTEVQGKTLELLGSLIADGLAEFGGLRDHGAGFEPWDTSLHESLRRISVSYGDRFDDRAGWPWTVWLRITPKGKDLGKSWEPAYQRWLDELREQNREDAALPVKFEPGGGAEEM